MAALGRMLRALVNSVSISCLPAGGLCRYLTRRPTQTPFSLSPVYRLTRALSVVSCRPTLPIPPADRLLAGLPLGLPAPAHHSGSSTCRHSPSALLRWCRQHLFAPPATRCLFTTCSCLPHFSPPSDIIPTATDAHFCLAADDRLGSAAGGPAARTLRRQTSAHL